MTTTFADDAGSAGGAAGAGSGAAGGEAGGQGGGAGGAEGAGSAAAYYEAFDSEPLKVAAAGWGFKTPQDLATGYANAEKRFGVDPAQLITLPKDPNDAEAVRGIYAKLGMPDKPDGYGIKLAENASEADKAMLGQALDTFHKAGLTASQAKVIGEWINGQTTAQATAAAEAFTAQAAEGKAALTKEWGAAADARFRDVGAAVAKYGDADLVKELGGDNLGRYPNVARMIGKMLDRMAEPGAAGGGSGEAAGQAQVMTPVQAKAAVAALNADPIKGKALTDRTHPMHDAVVKERSRLLAMADGHQPA